RECGRGDVVGQAGGGGAGVRRAGVGRGAEAAEPGFGGVFPGAGGGGEEAGRMKRSAPSGAPRSGSDRLDARPPAPPHPASTRPTSGRLLAGGLPAPPPRGSSPSNRPPLAVTPCMKSSPPPAPSSPAAKTPASGIAPASARTARAS